MIVLAPARDIGPGHRRILAAADLKRQFKMRIWQGTDGAAAAETLMRTRVTRRKRIQGASDNATAITANAQPPQGGAC